MMDDIKKTQYLMLKELHRVCEEKGLTYYLCFGSLIGAIRHNGIIPWDDDIDIVMPRDDFKALVESYHSDRYEILWPYNSKEHTRSYGRIYDRFSYKKLGRHKALGLSVDINLIYGAPDSDEEYQKHVKTLKKLKMRRKWLNRVMRRLAQMYLWPKKDLYFNLLNKSVIAIEQEYAKYPIKKDGYVILSPFYKKFRYASFAQRELHLFEDDKFYIPIGYDEILRNLYGDYMTLPPENERIHNHGRSSYVICTSVRS